MSNHAAANGATKPMPQTPKPVWDEETQQFHGGQDWAQCGDVFVEDFSVTTNALGTPETALNAARESLSTCHHYPPANQEPALSSLARFLWPEEASFAENRQRLILGNGASEMIDLVIRLTKEGPFQPGPFDIQYKEYERAAISNGRSVMSGACLPYQGPASTTPPAILSIVNACNPTGDYLSLNQLKAWIMHHAKGGTTVIVDESMQPWLGPAFRHDSAVSIAGDFLRNFGIHIYVIHSWTKLWSCTGLRLGSVVCPSAMHAKRLRAAQVPWSVNTPALAFLDAVVRDEAYLAETWKVTPEWRVHLCLELMRVNSIVTPNQPWVLHGKPFLSWVWVELGDEALAGRMIAAARAAGVPVRWGREGYNRPSFVRVAVREPSKVAVLTKAWCSLASN